MVGFYNIRRIETFEKFGLMQTCDQFVKDSKFNTCCRKTMQKDEFGLIKTKYFHHGSG